MLSQKYVKFIQVIEIFNQMSKDLDIGRLTNHEKDTLLSLYRGSKDDKNIDVRSIDFISYNGKAIPRSTLYKALKSLCNKNIIKRLGSQRSSIYKLK